MHVHMPGFNFEQNRFKSFIYFRKNINVIRFIHKNLQNKNYFDLNYNFNYQDLELINKLNDYDLYWIEIDSQKQLRMY